jgi:molybdopterin-containing oxidoreductase family iron-sulfur binding subunit
MSDTDSSELIFDEEWEADAEERLALTEYDTDLGKELARDAQRMAAGDLSESEFYEKYHEEVVEEFGVDHRGDVAPPDDDEDRFGYDTESSAGESSGPPGGDGGDGNGNLPGAPGDDPERRDVLKTAGALGAGAVGLNTIQNATQNASQNETEAGEEDDEDLQWGMAINQNNCIACLNCIEACNEENNNTPDALWMFVHRYVEDDYSDEEEYLTRPCQHCSDSPCTAACPVTARHTRDEDGIVLTDYESCIGCRYCEVACPYGVNYLQWATPREREEFESSRGIADLYSAETKDGVEAAGPPPQGVMGKCTFCVHRQDSGREELRGTTACEDICPADAIHFGNLEDEESAPRQHLDELGENENTFRLLEDHGTEPNIVYVGNEPSPDAKPVEGPRTVEDMNRELSRSRTGREPVHYPSEGD